jgi:hypothetical protein
VLGRPLRRLEVAGKEAAAKPGNVSGRPTQDGSASRDSGGFRMLAVVQEGKLTRLWTRASASLPVGGTSPGS